VARKAKQPGACCTGLFGSVLAAISA